VQDLENPAPKAGFGKSRAQTREGHSSLSNLKI